MPRLFFLNLALIATGVAQDLPQEALLGLLGGQADVPVAAARKRCLDLPVKPPDDRLVGPHEGSLVSTRCEVASYKVLDEAAKGWSVAHYRWTSAVSATADNVTEEEAVLFESTQPGEAHPVWHARIETGVHGILRSVTPEIAAADPDTILLSVMSCVNGTGGCNQEFLGRRADGRWFAVRQDWLDQLPQGFRGRIRHGVRIDPRTLRGGAGFYREGDPNCCPSETLLVDLSLHRNALLLLRHAVVQEQEVSHGQPFRQGIAPGLVLVLRPTDSGWMIGVEPESRCVENGDWAAVVNAPYRNYNALHLDASYGISAREAVKINPREFSYVTTCEDYKAEAHRLENVLWPYNYSKKEADEALAKLGTSAQGKARLTILDSRVGQTGKIDWLKFEIEILSRTAR